MKTVVVGDSFALHIEDTWIEYIADIFNLDIVFHKAIGGSCEFFIYEHFLESLKNNKIELALFVHTERTRLVNPKKAGIVQPACIQEFPATTDFNVHPYDLFRAGKIYYEKLYYDPFHNWVHKNLIEEMQQICCDKNIIQIHIFSWPEEDIDHIGGLWITGGLVKLSVADDPNFAKSERALYDNRKNHLSKETHIEFGKWLAPHIQYFLSDPLRKSTVDLNIKEIEKILLRSCK